MLLLLLFFLLFLSSLSSLLLLIPSFLLLLQKLQPRSRGCYFGRFPALPEGSGITSGLQRYTNPAISNLLSSSIIHPLYSCSQSSTRPKPPLSLTQRRSWTPPTKEHLSESKVSVFALFPKWLLSMRWQMPSESKLITFHNIPCSSTISWVRYRCAKSADSLMVFPLER